MAKLFRSLKNLPWQCNHEWTKWFVNEKKDLAGRWCSKCNKKEYAKPEAVIPGFKKTGSVRIRVIDDVSEAKQIEDNGDTP